MTDEHSPRFSPPEPAAGAAASAAPADSDARSAAESASQGTPAAPEASVAAAREVTGLVDGDWHRMHPMTPLLRGGIVLIIVIGYLISTMQERIVSLFVPRGERGDDGEGFNGDPLAWILENNLIPAAVGVVIGVLLIVVALMWVSWRFHTFRVTDTEVEVRQGVLFRSHRRSPLDRVQGVNLTRPLIARLIGLAKLEVVGAGSDGNARLEYLSGRNAERVRTAILQLASGARVARQQRAQARGDGPPSAAGGQTRGEHPLVATIADGLTGLIEGDIDPSIAPESVVQIPTGRIIGSRLLHSSMLWFAAIIAAVIIAGVYGHTAVLLALIPTVLALVPVVIGSVLKSLRYSIAPTPDGLRVTFGLTTTITEIIPPGRLHAVEVVQPMLWRMCGWYLIRVNRLSGRSTTGQASDPFATILPVGTLDDVRRVLALIFPDVTEAQQAWILQQGFAKRPGEDAFSTSPRRAWFTRPLSYARTGFLLGPAQLLLRRGRVWRSLTFLPMARVQSISVRQGPLLRAARIAALRIDTVFGPVNRGLTGIDRDSLLELFACVEASAIEASRADRSHRWAASETHTSHTSEGPTNAA